MILVQIPSIESWLTSYHNLHDILGMSLELLKQKAPQLMISTDAQDLAEYGHDWTKNLEHKASAVVFPKTTEEVQQIVLWANETKMALVPSGGRTGLSGGATALNGEVILSLEKMNKILSYDDVEHTLWCDAGVITETIQDFAKEKDLLYPVDFAARGSSQIGGNVATNAGGIKVIRYGLTRSWVTGLEVVTGKGEVLNLNNGLIKNATGYDLRHLMIGSEGTLAVITKVGLQLTKASPNLSVFLFALQDLKSIMTLFQALRKKVELQAFEMFTDKAIQCVLKQHTDLKNPFSNVFPYYVLCEVEAESVDATLEVFEQGLTDSWIQDGVQSQSPQQSKDFWRLREDISEATSPYSPYKNDISVRIAQVPEFLEKMNDILSKEYPTFEVVWFGHIGDGNLHINILKPENLSRDEFVKKCQSVNKSLFQMIHDFGGSISAEHGVGVTKKDYLNKTRSPEEIELMKGIKKVFDPSGILNPGKVI